MNTARKIAKDKKVLNAFVRRYCKDLHKGADVDGRGLCAECGQLLDYALARTEKCPLDPKPTCKKCPVHCYKPGMRERIRKVMKHSGISFIKRGRLDWVVRYFF